MKGKRAALKEELLKRYSQALEELLEESEGIEDFGELEEAVNGLAQKTLPRTLSALQESKDFSPSVPKVSKSA
jgi:DNA-binding HxlR family transcriptional regulator